ncbi:MAG: YigZ family protein [Rhodobacteraceae bacterium]|nr:YigZ family protein [Paracoccaceae bacterium]
MDYQTIKQSAFGELEDRKSRFLAFLEPIAVFDQKLEELRKEHRKANHFVTAHRHLLEDGRLEESGKDDGEPSGTSGMPTLKVLQGARLVEAGVIVVRYFGGTKLGGGGLARAYSGAAAVAIENSKLVPFIKMKKRRLSVSFADSAELEQQIARLGLEVIERDFTEQGVTFELEGPESLINGL